MKGLYGHSGFTMIAGILIFAALVLALQFCLASVQGQTEIPSNAVPHIGDNILSTDA